MSILIIADDLSGAADCAIGFACAGHRTLVALNPIPPHGVQRDFILAIDTDTRRLEPAAAARLTSSVYAEMRPGKRRLYKKIDSTLRGNWAAEVASLQPMAGMAIVAPAHPAAGRTVRGGQVHVHGQPLAQTDLWQLEHGARAAGIAEQLRDARLSVAMLDAEALQDQPAELALRLKELAAGGVQSVVVDAQSVPALKALAYATLQSNQAVFWVGSGGLAREIAALHPVSGTAGAGQVQPSGGPILTLVGSLSAVSERQCAALRDGSGVEELVVMPGLLRGGALHTGWPALQARIGELLAAGTDLLLRIGRDAAFNPAEGALLSSALAKLIGPHFGKTGGVIATGGETARAMLAEAGIETLEVLAELETGVAVGIPIDAGRTHRPWIVTKAGAFGSDRALYQAWAELKSLNAKTSTQLTP